MRRIWGKTGAGEVKGRTALRRIKFILAFGALLGAGLLASGAFGMASEKRHARSAGAEFSN